MQEERIKSILAYLDNKKLSNYSGGIRMGFEAGRPSSFAETSFPDKEIPKIDNYFVLKNEIEIACSDDFFGTLFMVLQEGMITHFYRNRTYQGNVLDTLLGTSMKSKKRVAVVIKR